MTDSNPTPTQSPSVVRSRWGRLLPWIGLFSLLVIVAAGMARSRPNAIAEGRPAPDFTLRTFEGEEIKLSSLRGKVVVLNFWASWCDTCKQEAADLESAWRFYQKQGNVVFLGIAYTDTEPASKAYLAEFNITYPNGADLQTRISRSYRLTGVPETYIVDQAGILRYKKLSPFVSLAEIRASIDPLLAP